MTGTAIVCQVVLSYAAMICGLGTPDLTDILDQRDRDYCIDVP